MKKSKIILITIFVIAVAAVLYFAYGVVKNRYLSEADKMGTGSNETQDQDENIENENQSSGQFGENNENVSPDIDNTAPAEGRPDVQKTDCDSNCVNFKSSPDNFKYCQEVCGDRPVSSKDSESQCEELSGLEKDSCWRDLAVSKKDFSICDKIEDAKLKKVCKNRVTEELLN